MKGRFCLVHAGVQNMAALGQLGGRARTRSMVGVELDDSQESDKLRAKARQALEQALVSSDEKVRFQAARALFSYGPAKAPADEEDEHAPANVGAMLKALLKPLDRMPDGRVNALVDDELASMLMRTWKKSGQAADMDENFERWAEKVAELGRRKLHAGAPPQPKPPPKPAVPTPAAEPAPVPSAAAPVPPPAAREQLEVAALNGIREKVEWEFRQDWQRPPSPAELDERVRRARKEALEDEDDAA